MRTFHTILLVLVCTFAAASAANAELIIYGTQTDHVLVPGASLEDVRLSVDLSVTGGIAAMRLANVSVGSGASAVFKEIVIDAYDDDTDAAVLWSPAIVDTVGEVAFTIVPSNGLPGYQNETGKERPLVELQADSPPVVAGLGVGEAVVVEFGTCLPDGSDIGDYIAAFGDGEDTALYTIGFHAISADTVNGESLSGTHTPEPATLSLVVLGACAVLLRWRRNSGRRCLR